MMKKINIDNTNIELKYTFNSFKYMEDFDIDELNMVEHKPFRLIKIARIMLMGAVNNDSKVFISDEKCDRYLENSITKGKLVELVESLSEILAESDFFKGLQSGKEQIK